MNTYNVILMINGYRQVSQVQAMNQGLARELARATWGGQPGVKIQHVMQAW